jgi:hypothetical protein
MPEFFGDFGHRGAPGALVDGSVLNSDMLILISLVFADQEITRLDARVRTLWSEHQETELLHRLTSTAAVLRARDDWLLDQLTVLAPADAVERLTAFRACTCGKMQPEVRSAEQIDLTLREACNKIMHARRVTFDVEGDNPETRFIRPVLYLYGMQRAAEWRAVLDLRRYVELGTLSTDHA